MFHWLWTSGCGELIRKNSICPNYSGLAPRRLPQRRVVAVEVGLHLGAAVFVHEFPPHYRAGIGLAGARGGELALHAVRAFADHHGDVVGALVVHHHVHDLAGLGDADGDFFGLHAKWRS